jgi:aspartate-semialdehyde dehydrogenase
MVLALAPLHRRVPIRRAVVCTYQSVSGAGQDNIDALFEQSRRLLERPDLLLGRPSQSDVEQVAGTARPIAFNLLPQWKWMPDGVTEEEHKITQETGKIMEVEIPVSVTTVRVPVVVGHLVALHLEFAGPLSVNEARGALADAEGVELADDPERGAYPMPLYATGRDVCIVGRLRPDPTVPYGLRLLAAADNLRKGAALDAVQIAEELVRDGRLAGARA